MPARSTARAIVVHKNCVLMMERWRRDPKSGKELHYFSLPGGKIEQGETPETAVVREVFEEMGVIVRTIQKAAVQKRTGGGQNIYFVCQYASGEPRLSEDSQEFERSHSGNRYQPLWVSREHLATLKLHADYQPLLAIIEDAFNNKFPSDQPPAKL